MMLDISPYTSEGSGLKLITCTHAEGIEGSPLTPVRGAD